MAKMFRVGLKWINLSMVTQIEEHAGQSWGDDDERQPRIFIHLIGNSGFELLTREAVSAGYVDMAACTAALIAAMDAYHG